MVKQLAAMRYKEKIRKIMRVEQTVGREEWLDYRDELLKIMLHTEKRNQLKFASQIDEALLNRRAFLFVSEDGFFVLKPIVDEDSNTHVEVLFAFSWTDNAIDKYQSVVEEMTLMIGGKSIIIYTIITGLMPILKKHGYTLKTTAERLMCWDKQLS